MLQDALRAEHITVLHAIEFDLFGGVLGAVLDLRLGHLARAERRIGRGCHGQAGKHLVVDGQIVRIYLMSALVIGTLDNSVLGKLTDTFTAERVTAWQRRWFLIVVIVGLKTDAALENGIHLCFYYISRY